VTEKPSHCICYQDGVPPYQRGGQKIETVFMGVADCTVYVGTYPSKHTFQGKGPTVDIVNDGGLGLGHMATSIVEDLVFMCGGTNYYYYLPRYWSGCCYYAHLTMPVNIIHMSDSALNISSPDTFGWTDTHIRAKRSLSEFSAGSFGHKVPWYEKVLSFFYPQLGTLTLSLHVDSLSYTMWGFANATTKGFSLIKDTLKSHRLTLLKHQLALDYLLAKTGGLCVTLNLTDGSCMTLIPDNTDNLTDVITALDYFRSALGKKSGLLDAADQDWLASIVGSWGTRILQVVLPVIVTLLMICLFAICFVSCIKAMINRCVTTSLTAVAIQSDVQVPAMFYEECKDMDENNCFQDLQDYLDDKLI